MNKFFKCLLVAVTVGMIGSGVMAADLPRDEQAASTESSGCGKNFYNMGRGLGNIATCWMEVPRALVYHNSQLPVLGVVVGACQGVGYTAVRAFAGVADILSFGFMSDSIYESCGDFKEWVWQSPWLPEE